MIADALATMFGGRQAATFDALNPRDPAIAKMLGLGTNARSGVRVDGENVLGIPALLRGVSILSNALMKVKPIIYRRLPGPEGDREKDLKHPSWKVVTRRANALMSAGTFRKTLTAWAIYRGNGLAHIERDGAGRVIEMLPLLPDRSGMAIFRGGQKIDGEESVRQGDQVRYWTMVGGECVKLLPENVIHIKGLSSNGLWGLDIVSVMRETFGSCIAARDFSASFFGQGAMGSGIVFMPPGLKDHQQEDFVKAVKKGSEGLGRAHRLMVLENLATYTQMTIDPEKASLTSVMQAQIVDIANAVGIQSHKVGDSSRVAYNSLEQSNQEHLDDDLDPHLQTWEDELSDKTLSEEEKENETHYVEFNRQSLVRVNLEARTARETFERTYGIATANDIIRRSNGTPIGPVGDTYLIPTKMRLISKDGLPILGGEPDNTPPSDGGDNGDGGDPEDDPTADGEDTTDDGGEAPPPGAFAELALHEIERLATRACREATEQARQGSAKFAEWLDRLPTWPQKPKVIDALIGSTLAHIHQAFDAYTKPPYGAAGLAANIASAADAVRASAINQAREQLEAVA